MKWRVFFAISKNYIFLWSFHFSIRCLCDLLSYYADVCYIYINILLDISLISIAFQYLLHIVLLCVLYGEWLVCYFELSANIPTITWHCHLHSSFQWKTTKQKEDLLKPRYQTNSITYSFICSIIIAINIKTFYEYNWFDFLINIWTLYTMLLFVVVLLPYNLLYYGFHHIYLNAFIWQIKNINSTTILLNDIYNVYFIICCCSYVKSIIIWYHFQFPIYE